MSWEGETELESHIDKVDGRCLHESDVAHANFICPIFSQGLREGQQGIENMGMVSLLRQCWLQFCVFDIPASPFGSAQNLTVRILSLNLALVVKSEIS